jgi:hypothetical protein
MPLSVQFNFICSPITHEAAEFEVADVSRTHSDSQVEQPRIFKAFAQGRGQRAPIAFRFGAKAELGARL